MLCFLHVFRFIILVYNNTPNFCSDYFCVVGIAEKLKIHRVQNAKISETGNTSLTVMWEKPKGPVTGYLVTCQTTAAAATPRDKKSKKKEKKKEKEKEEGGDDGGKEEVEEEEIKEEMEMVIDDADQTRAVYEGLKSDEEYVIKIYTMSGTSKSERVKVTGKTGQWKVNYG